MAYTQYPYPWWGIIPPNQQTGYPYQQSYSGTSYQKPNQSNLLKVTGPESAKAYPVGPNSTVALFDGDQAIFYLKTTDDAGFATLRTFKFEEVSPEPAQQQIEVTPVQADYVTKDDLKDILDSFKADVISALKQDNRKKASHD